MHKIAAVLLFLWLPILGAGTAMAADEDTQASVYLVFDAETGEFVTVDDADATAQHKAEIDQEAIESGTKAEGSPDTPSLTWPVGIVVIVLLLGGVVWFMRKRKKIA